MQIDNVDGHLKVHLDQDLNWFTARRIRHLAEGCAQVELDLQHARLVDTEGLILLYDLSQSGIAVRIHHPPDLLFELADLLELTDVIGLHELCASH